MPSRATLSAESAVVSLRHTGDTRTMATRRSWKAWTISEPFMQSMHEKDGGMERRCHITCPDCKEKINVAYDSAHKNKSLIARQHIRTSPAHTNNPPTSSSASNEPPPSKRPREEAPLPPPPSDQATMKEELAEKDRRIVVFQEQEERLITASDGLRNTVASLQEQNTGLRTDVSSLKQQMEQLQQQDRDKSLQMHALSEQMKAMQVQLGSLKQDQEHIHRSLGFHAPPTPECKDVVHKIQSLQKATAAASCVQPSKPRSGPITNDTLKIQRLQGELRVLREKLRSKTPSVSDASTRDITEAAKTDAKVARAVKTLAELLPNGAAKELMRVAIPRSESMIDDTWDKTGSKFG